MSHDDTLRNQLVELLTGAHAHAGFRKSLAGLDPALRGRRPGPGTGAASSHMGGREA